MSTVVYGVDLATYELGAQGQVIGRKGLAWARIALTPETDLVDPSGFRARDMTGCELPQLASRVAADVRQNAKVALGFEAPMWTPAPAELPKRGRVFKARFEEEVGREWYLQSGAAATVKALTLGKLLFSLLRQLGVRPECTTARVPAPRQLALYEAFVTGLFRSEPLPGFSQDRWDAVSAALAYTGAILGRSLSDYRAVELGPTSVPPGEIFSHWATIVASTGIGAKACAAPAQRLPFYPLYRNENRPRGIGTRRLSGVAAGTAAPRSVSWEPLVRALVPLLDALLQRAA